MLVKHSKRGSWRVLRLPTFLRLIPFHLSSLHLFVVPSDTCQSLHVILWTLTSLSAMGCLQAVWLPQFLFSTFLSQSAVRIYSLGSLEFFFSIPVKLAMNLKINLGGRRCSMAWNTCASRGLGRSCVWQLTAICKCRDREAKAPLGTAHVHTCEQTLMCRNKMK